MTLYTFQLGYGSAVTGAIDLIAQSTLLVTTTFIEALETAEIMYRAAEAEAGNVARLLDRDSRVVWMRPVTEQQDA